LESANLDRNEIDLIIVATATPDRKAPSTACLTKHKLGITSTSPALDVAAVCSGFIYSLNLASALLAAGAHRKILIIGADTFSKITDWSRRDCVFFGDGAGAVVVEQSPDAGGLYCGEIFADTRETDHFTVYPHDEHFTMNGRAVYETGSKVLPEAIRRLLNENGLEIGDVDCIVPHQPSQRLLKKMAETLAIPFSKVKTNMRKYANTSGATVPLLLDETVKEGGIKSGDLVVLAAVGSGWTWGAALFRWR
jgi:3-oxoacyl-[acyl-carrier-protein] synthase-3